MEEANHNCKELKINIVATDKSNNYANDLTPKIRKKRRIISNKSIRRT
jgi:hypothetical protein